MFACNALIPALLIISGWAMRKHCPKKINRVIGYRTSRSMKNDDTWRFAHDYCGRLWFISGLVILLPTVIAQLPFYHSSTTAVSIASVVIEAVQCAVLVISIVFTEKALKKEFTDNGARRNI